MANTICNRRPIRTFIIRQRSKDDYARWIAFSESDVKSSAEGAFILSIVFGGADPPFPLMESLEQIKNRAELAARGAKIDIVVNPGPSQQSSLLLDHEHAVAVAKLLRDHPVLTFDYCSNVTGVDWLDRVVKKTTKVKTVVEGVEKEIDQTTEEKIPGYLEAVYHLYSIKHKQGPLIIRMRTANRTDGARLPSLTPIWRSAELQEREIFDLYGIHFEGHPDLRRILMWDEFVDHPMRKDYRDPDDYEWEPTPHDEVMERAKQHYAPRPALDGAEALRAAENVNRDQ